MDIECGGFTFISNFDSSNIDRVELVPQAENVEDQTSEEKEIPILEFNIWTKTDCAGTEFANSNRSWFYFGVKGGLPCTNVKLNVVNLNKQGKLYNQGMAPVYKITPGPNRWERVRDFLSFDLKNNLLSFGYRTVENLCSTTYFAFTYPYSFVDLQNSYKSYDAHLKKMNINPNALEANPDDIYYHRECLIKSLEGRPVDLITISSHHGITSNREPRLKGLFPDTSVPRSYAFKGKKVIFLSARVHPGETPSSFVMNGVLHLLLNKVDPTAMLLRKLFVFKLIPMLNPDGVSKGFYRTDTRGANLNRFYLNPSEVFHPSVYAARSLILYYHYGCEKKVEPIEPFFVSAALDPAVASTSSISIQLPPPPFENTDTDRSEADSQTALELELSAAAAADASKTAEVTMEGDAATILFDADKLNDKVAEISMEEGSEAVAAGATATVADRLPRLIDEKSSDEGRNERCAMCGVPPSSPPTTPMQLPKISSTGVIDSPTCRKKLGKMRRPSRTASTNKSVEDSRRSSHESGLYLYVDFHGHASKRGIFMYGNHFDNINDKVECMLLPKLLSLNNSHFHYNQCNFSRRNMYTRDRRDGLSKEGSGRVAVLKYTGLVRSYTLECNYNTGCIVNIIPPTQRPLGKHLVQPLLVPPKYTPQIYEEVGRALCVSILDMSGCNPNSRLSSSQYKNVNGLREALRCEAILAKSSQSQNVKMRQGIALLQRGNKNVGKSFVSKRKTLLKRQSKNNLFPELAASSQSLDKKSGGGVSSAAGSSCLHPLSKCVSGGVGGVVGGSSLAASGSMGKLKKQRKQQQQQQQQQSKKLAMMKSNKKKLFAAYKLEKDHLWPSGRIGESSSERGAGGKRKIEKKSSPTGSAGPSVRPPNKKRKKSKII